MVMGLVAIKKYYTKCVLKNKPIFFTTKYGGVSEVREGKGQSAERGPRGDSLPDGRNGQGRERR